MGIYKDSLILAEIHKKSNREAGEDVHCAANRLLEFLGEVAARYRDAVVDHRLYDVEVEAGTISFVSSRDDSVLGL